MALTKMIHYKEDGVDLCRDAGFLHKEGKETQAKQWGIKSYFPNVLTNHHHAACRLLSPTWAKYLAFCPCFFCCKLTILTSICFPGFPSRFPLKKNQKTFWREVCHLERKGEENRRRTDSLPLIPMATQSGQIIWGFNTQSLSFMKGLKRWCFYQLPKYAIFRSALLLLSLFHLQVPLLAFNLGI